MLKRGVAGVDHDLREQRGHLKAGQRLAQCLLQQVSNHPLGLRTKDIERVWAGVRVRLLGQREQSDLRPVSMRQHESMLTREARERARRGIHVALLDGLVHPLATAEQRVPAERRHDQHQRASTDCMYFAIPSVPRSSCGSD